MEHFFATVGVFAIVILVVNIAVFAPLVWRESHPKVKR